MHINDDSSFAKEIVDLFSGNQPKVLFKDETVLELNVEEVQNEVINRETDGKPVRVTVQIISTKVKRIVIREFDPEKSYADSLTEFTKP
jgi:hypothetical protein